MINPITNIIKPISFGRNISKYEQQDIHCDIKAKAPNEIAVINDIIQENGQNNLFKGLLYDKFGFIFENSNNNSANILYENAVKEKNNSNVPVFELFKSYIALKKTYQKMGKNDDSEKIDNILNEKIKEVGFLTKEELSVKNQKEFDELFINSALVACKKLFQLNKTDSALALFNEISATIENSPSKSNDYKELKAVLLEKNGLHKEASDLYKDLAKNNKSSKKIEYQHKFIQNQLSLGNYAVDADLDDCLENAATDKEIVENLFIRSNKELLQNSNDNAAKYLNLALVISQKSDFDIQEQINLLKAILLRNYNDIEKSSEVCEENLDNLEKKNKLFSDNFIRTLILLATNDYSEYKLDSLKNKDKLLQAMNAYKNAFEIANILDDDYLKFLITSRMANVYFEQDDEKHINATTNYILKNTDEAQFKADAHRILGLWNLKQNDLITATEHFENERKYILGYSAPKNVIQENINNLVESYRKNGEINKAEEYSKILNDKKSARYKDLMELGNINIRNGEYKKAQEYFEQALNLDNEESSSKAMAKINIGIAKLKTQNDKKH